jgi:uncharacterized phage protein (predicted DNA packaging)
MALDLATLKEQCNVTFDDDDAVLTRCLNAAQAHFVRLLGFDLDDADEFPDGTPADVEQGVLMLGAHYYENREATLIGVSAMVIPMGVAAIVAEYRNYTFGLADDD